MASIGFDDGSGVDYIDTADADLPTSRFNNWIPDPQTLGEKRHTVGGVRHQFPLSTHHQASFELPRIPHSDEEIVQRFVLWARQGGIFTLNTDDSEANSYDNCQLAPNTEIVLRRDPVTMEFTINMTVINLDGNPLRCVYA